jgi:hypothetical protein
MPLTSPGFYQVERFDPCDQSVANYITVPSRARVKSFDSSTPKRSKAYSQFRLNPRSDKSPPSVKDVSRKLGSIAASRYLGVASPIAVSDRKRLKDSYRIVGEHFVPAGMSALWNHQKSYGQIWKTSGSLASNALLKYYCGRLAPLRKVTGSDCTVVRRVAPSDVRIDKSSLARLSGERGTLLREKYLGTLSSAQSDRLLAIERILASASRERLRQRRQSPEYKDRQDTLALIRSLADALEKNLIHGNRLQKADSQGL